MKDQEEDRIVAELDRELSRKDGLIALVVCLGLGAWMIVMAAINVASAG